MDASLLFRQALARRVVRFISLVALPAPLVAGCGSDVVTSRSDGDGVGGSGGFASDGGSGGTTPGDGGASDGGGSSGGMGGLGAGGSSASGGGTRVKQCIDWPDAHDASTCPPSDEAFALLDPVTCGFSSVSAPAFENGKCCYMVTPISDCGTGRPYMVDGRAVRAARVAEASGWVAGARQPELGGLSPEQRARLARAWSNDGLLEHASVASFSRFSLELMAVGAPADLVAAAHGAALDEIEHARLCFALASAYAGSSIGPSAFPFDGRVEVGVDLAALAASTVREGCIGETLAAVLAAEQLGRATDPAVREVLARIAQDEARHAELAWRTVAWALSVGGAPVSRAVVEAFASSEAIVAAFAGSPDDAGDTPVESHGLLDRESRAAVLQRAIADVVRPGARALLQAPGATDAHSRAFAMNQSQSS